MSPASSQTSSAALIPAASNRPGDDPIFTLNAEAAARAAAGESVLNATLGALVEDDGTLSVMPAVAEGYRRIPQVRASAYAPISGPPHFLAGVIEDLYGPGPMAERSVATATPGGTGAIHNAIVNFIEPGQSLLTSSFRWSPYDIIADHTRRGVETFPMYDGAGRFHVDAYAETLEAQVVRQGRALVILNTPCHNPTGYSLDAEEWRQVVEGTERAAEKGPVTVLLDLAYARFAPETVERFQPHAERLSERMAVLVAWSASKAYAQYGARVGSLVASHADDAERGRIENALGYSCRGTWSNCNHYGMLAIAEVLTDPELRAQCDRERQHLIELLGARVEAFNALARDAGLEYPRYEGGFFVSVFTPDARGSAAHMREAGVFAVPLQGAVRAALCSTPEREVPRLVKALVEGVRAVGG